MMAVLEREVLTPGQVADYLQVQPRTVMEWLRTGRLPGMKLGRLWRVRLRDLEGFLQLRQIASSVPDLDRKPLREYSDDEIADMLDADRVDAGNRENAQRKAAWG